MLACIPLFLLLVPSGNAPQPYPIVPPSVHQDTLKVKEEKPGYRAQAKISGEAALRAALEKVPGGQMRQAELEKEHGRLVYSFDIVDPKQTGVEEVLVDASSGKVISKKHESAAAEAKEQADEAKEHGEQKSYH
jgi:peptidase YpeB-like protein